MTEHRSTSFSDQDNRVPRHPVVFVVPDIRGRIDADWLQQTLPRVSGQWLLPRGKVPATRLKGLLVEETDARPAQPEDWHRHLADRVGEGWLLVIQSGLEVPADYSGRMGRALFSPGAPAILAPAGSHDYRLDPLRGLHQAEAISSQDLDSLVSACGLNRWFGTHHLPLSCLALRPEGLPGLEHAPGDFRDIGLIDSILVHAPEAMRPPLPSRLPPPPLGHIREGVRALLQDKVHRLPGIGTDGRPVVLHIAHNWGGGVARWIGDFIEGDRENHHLVLNAVSGFEDRIFGKELVLNAAGAGAGAIQRWPLMPGIADTVTTHDEYRAILDWIVERYGVGKILVSSLIGHSLDCLDTTIPTTVVLHDYYPGWPLLDRDPYSVADGADRPDLQRALGEHGEELLFRDARPAYWQKLLDQWKEIVDRRGIPMIAPSRGVIERWQGLLGTGTSIGSGDNGPAGTGARTIHQIPHALAPWKTPPEPVSPAPRRDGRLQLVVVGQISEGKGAGLLREALDKLRPLAQITLVGAGRHGMKFFGQGGINIIYRYRPEELPGILADIRPHAALFLSTTAETWNYTLSEVRSLGIVPLATELGSFAERIRDQIDGMLFKPEADDLVRTITALHKNPDKIGALAQNLPPEGQLQEMVQAYHRLQPPHQIQPRDWKAANPAEIRLAGLGGRLADRELLVDALRERDARLEQELAERARWAETMERQFRERTRWALSLDADLDEMRTSLVERDRKLEQRERQLAERERELQETTTRAEHLALEREQMLASRSWRITRPLRVAGRLYRNARRRGMFNPVRWPGATLRLLRHMRHRGVRQSFWLLQSEPAEAARGLRNLSVDTPEADSPLEPVDLPKTDRPAVSIIVPVHNQVHFTGACLASIAARGANRPYEVIVVDDESSDETEAFLKKCSGLRVLRNAKNLGFIGSCNRGARSARGDYLVFLNNDTTVTEGWLDALIDTFERFPDTGIAGAKLVYPDGTLQEAGGIIFSDASGWNYGRGDNPDLPAYNFVCQADYVSGACLAIPRALWKELGGFDTQFSPAYYEDTDLCFRVREKGRKVMYQPACAVVHHEGISCGTDESTGTKRFQTINREKFRKRWEKILPSQPQPVPGPEALAEVELARHHRCRQRVLVVDATTPTPDQDSGSVRLFELLSILREESCRVSFMPENLAWNGRHSRDLQRTGVEVLCAPWVTGFQDWLATRGSQLDVILVSRHYVLAPLLSTIKRYSPQARVIFDTVDLHFLREEREARLTGSTRMERAARKSRSQELALVRNTHHTLVVSPVEQSLLSELAPAADVRVVSNIHTVRPGTQPWSKRRDLLFVGGFQHQPNVDAARWLIGEIFPEIRRRLDGVRLHIIGSKMPESFHELKTEGVRLHGFVADLEPYLNGCRLSLAPLRYGAGVKGKVNQAMSWGLPVIATSCAAEGMFLEHGRDVMVADDVAGFCDCVEEAYSSETRWNTLSAGGKANVERYFSRDAAKAAVLPLLDPPKAEARQAS